MMLLTLRGTPTIYQGDELGMENVPIPPDRVMDPWEKNVPGISLGRDPVRTPIAWTGGPGAGFTTGRAVVAHRYATRDSQVDAQAGDRRSMLSAVSTAAGTTTTRRRAVARRLPARCMSMRAYSATNATMAHAGSPSR